MNLFLPNLDDSLSNFIYNFFSYDCGDVYRLTLILLILVTIPLAYSQATFEESKNASRVIGRWLSVATGHYDFLSATTVNPKRAGDKFFGTPDVQFASDYGFSLMSAPRDSAVTKAYKDIGAETSGMNNSLLLPRFHLAWGIKNKHDITASYLLPGPDKIEGWGVGYKRVLMTDYYIYFTYRLNYSRSSREDYFTGHSLTHDLSASLYLRLIDFYVGLRHWSGKVNFDSTIPDLHLSPVNYFSGVHELEHYVGVRAATTTNTRFTLEANSLGATYSLAAQLSFHFDSLFPSIFNLFRDPRYIKQ